MQLRQNGLHQFDNSHAKSDWCRLKVLGDEVDSVEDLQVLLEVACLYYLAPYLTACVASVIVKFYMELN